MKYIDAEKLKEIIDEKYREFRLKGFKEDLTYYYYADGLDLAEQLIDSLQQEQPVNTDNLCSELADFLIRNDIQEEKAKSLANRIADEYGSKRYIDGLCDGLKEEQSKVLEVKDGDLDREIKRYEMNNPIIGHKERSLYDYMANVAKHFFELGIQQSKHFIDWQRNSDTNKPPKNHSILIQTTHGIAEGEWNGEKWIQYRWNSFIKDEDVLAWIELSNILNSN